MDAVARLHRLLAENPAEAAVSLGEYFQDISTAIVAARSDDLDIRLQFACDSRCFVPSERALSLGFVVVEQVTNAVKYAHPTGVAGEIRVGCEQRPEGTIIVEVSDDGVGLPEGMDPMKFDSLGLRAVQSLGHTARRQGGVQAQRAWIVLRAADPGGTARMTSWKPPAGTACGGRK